MLKFLLDLLTDHDNDGDIVSILGAIATITMIGLQIFVTYHSKTFDPNQFGMGIGLLLAGLGGGYFAKSKAG